MDAGLAAGQLCPRGLKFDYAIASHVIEHVPNPVGWMLEIFDVLKVGAVLSLAVPDKRYSFDLFRRETDSADLIDAWMRDESVPSPRQIFDFLSRSVDGSAPAGTRAFEVDTVFEKAQRYYTDDQALQFAAHSWRSTSYLDVHCSVFTPQGFYNTLVHLNTLGILNASVSRPVENPDEFFVALTKLGEPSVQRPVPENDEKWKVRVKQLEAHLSQAHHALGTVMSLLNNKKCAVAAS